MSSNRVYGIDLGTTYSCIAYVDEYGKPVVIPNAEGETTTPSVVYFETPDNYCVGQTAKDVAQVSANLVSSMVKRVMGDENWVFGVHGKSYRPQEVSAFILRKLAEDAATATNEPATDVVITVPAYFGTAQREATRQAGIIAGLNVLYVIPEPTAAAFAYGAEQEEDQVVLVYDLGGGTFDVTLIDVSKGEIRAIATGGDHELGGGLWDEAIVAYFMYEFSRATGVPEDDLQKEPEVYQSLLNEAERCKKRLSNANSVKVPIHFEGRRVPVELTRDKFDEITNSLLERTVSLTQEMLGRAREKGYEHIDLILLVGGSTYMPQVQKRVKAQFPAVEVRQYDPNQIVAKGAALFGHKCQLEKELESKMEQWFSSQPAAARTEQQEEVVREKVIEEIAREQHRPVMAIKGAVDKRIVNVVSKSFGVLIVDEHDQERVNNLVVVDDEVPASVTRRYATYRDRQTQVRIEIHESTNRTGPDDCFDHAALNEVSGGAAVKLLGEVVVDFASPLPRNSPIDVTFDLSPDGCLRVFGKDLTSGQEKEATFQTEAILSEAELASAQRGLMRMTRTN